MRRRSLIFIFVTSLAQAQTLKPELATLQFGAARGWQCSVSVRRPSSLGSRSQLSIYCERKLILSYSTDDDLVDISKSSLEEDRIVTRWEGGAHFRLAIFRVSITSHSAAAEKVFDEALDFAPDFLVSPDVLLVHRDKHYVASEAVPSLTEVYQWSGTKYELVKSWTWKAGMRFEDRFCVLDIHKLSCPVNPVPRPNAIGLQNELASPQ